MAGSLNKVMLIGSLGRDPESRSFQNGGKVVNLRLATSESWKDRTTGEKKERTEWHSVAIFAEGSANFAEKYLRKGSKVYVEGQLETRKWQDQAGADRYSTEIVVRPYSGTVTDLSGPSAASAGQGGDDFRGNRGAGQSQAGSYKGPDGPGFDDDMSDVPF